MLSQPFPDFHRSITNFGKIMHEYPPLVFYSSIVAVIGSGFMIFAEQSIWANGAFFIAIAGLVTAIGGVLIPFRNQNIKFEEMRKAERTAEADRQERAQNFENQILYLKNQNRLKDQKLDILEKRIDLNADRIKGTKTEIDLLRSDSDYFKTVKSGPQGEMGPIGPQGEKGEKGLSFNEENNG